MSKPRRQIDNKMSRKELLEVTAANLKMAGELLRVHEKRWQEDWDAAPNPWAALKQYKAQPNRSKIIQQWLHARREHDDARK
jgi:hypothetical protein